MGAGHLAAWFGGYLSYEGQNTITMKTNAAFCLTLISVALLLSIPARATTIRRWSARFCAVMVLVFGLLTLSENLFAWNLGIDQFLAAEAPGAMAVASPNRMGVPASSSFSLLGLTLLILSRRDGRGVRIAQGLALTVCLITLLASVGFLYGARELHAITRYTAIAWPTAMTLLLVGLGVLCTRPGEGLMAQVTANDSGGVSLRRLLPALIILPLLLGWLWLAGERAGLYDTPMGTAMVMLLLVVLFSVLAYHVSRRASRSAEALRDGQERLRAVFDNAGVGLVEIARDGRIIVANDRLCEILGYERRELVDKTIHELTAPEDRSADDDLNTQLHKGLINRIDYENRYLRRDGSPLWVHVTVSPVRDTQGRWRCSIGAIEDISERREAEEALRGSHARLSKVLEIQTVGVMFWDLATGRMTDANDTFLNMMGYSRQDVEARELTWQKLTPPEYVEVSLAEIRKFQATGRVGPYEKEYFRKDGTRRWLLFAGSSLGGNACVEFCVDIADRKRAQEALRESEERFRSVVASMSEGLMLFDAEGNLIYQNPASLRIHGFGVQEDGRIEHDTLPATWKAWDEKGRPITFEEWPVSRVFRHERFQDQVLRVRRVETGQEFYGSYNGSPIYDGDGKLKLGFITIRDISEQVRARIELAARERRLRVFFESDMVGTLFWNMDGRITDANDKFLQMFGYSREELSSGRVDWAKMTPPEYQGQDEYALNELRTTGVDTPYEKEYLRKDGARIPIIIGAAMLDEKRFDGVAFVLDITERKRAEEALRQLNATLESKVVQRTAELERRARQLQRLTLELTQAEERERRRIAVILHEDLQQQIVAAKFQLDLVRRRARDDGVLAQIDKVETMLAGAVEKSRGLSHDLGPAVVHMNDLAEVLRWLAKRVQDQYGLKVNVEVSGDMVLHSESLALFLFRATQEMLFNVVKHARIAEAAIRVRRIGRHISLCVSDRGRGFDLRQLTETSGIGIFSIRERTDLLGGRMKIKSEQGRGSRFRITVPDGPTTKGGKMKMETKEMDDLHTQTSAAVLSSPGGTLRVLLVDDHEIVRQGLAALLQEAPDIAVIGEAADGREAVDMTNDLRPDVVVMDVSMPLMSGDQATRLIKMHMPEIRVIALSMFDEAEKKERMYRAGAESYVLKTASAQELLSAVRGKEADL